MLHFFMKLEDDEFGMWCLPEIMTGCFSLEIYTGAFLSLPPTLKISSEPRNGLSETMGLFLGNGLLTLRARISLP